MGKSSLPSSQTTGLANMINMQRLTIIKICQYYTTIQLATIAYHYIRIINIYDLKSPTATLKISYEDNEVVMFLLN